jgi:hypothetical protein
MNVVCKSQPPQSLRDTRLGLVDLLPYEMAPLPLGPWPDNGYSAWVHTKSGALMGAVAACTSLLTNIIGSELWPAFSGHEQHALRIVQVYLTFPLGENALQLNSGMLLALGCVLYLVTGMMYGMFFEVFISYLLPHSNFRARVIVCSILALFVWAFNFYGILAWLQPLLLGGRWVIDLVPWWIAAGTHLVFGWTIALFYPFDEHGSARNEKIFVQAY